MNPEHLEILKGGIEKWNDFREGQCGDKIPDFSGADLSGMNLQKAKFENANMNGVDFTFADLTGADLSEAGLASSCFNKATLVSTNFSRASLCGAIFRMANAEYALFDSANLKRTRFGLANLNGACLANADLRNAKFNEASLVWADLHFACLYKTKPYHFHLFEDCYDKMDYDFHFSFFRLLHLGVEPFEALLLLHNC